MKTTLAEICRQTDLAFTAGQPTVQLGDKQYPLQLIPNGSTRVILKAKEGSLILEMQGPNERTLISHLVRNFNMRILRIYRNGGISLDGAIDGVYTPDVELACTKFAFQTT